MILYKVFFWSEQSWKLEMTTTDWEKVRDRMAWAEIRGLQYKLVSRPFQGLPGGLRTLKGVLAA